MRYSGPVWGYGYPLGTASGSVKPDKLAIIKTMRKERAEAVLMGLFFILGSVSSTCEKVYRLLAGKKNLLKTSSRIETHLHKIIDRFD
jgi:hypothetical protein